MNRRQTLKLIAGAAAFAGSPTVLARSAFAQAAPAFTLPPLGYAYEALEPHIDTATMNFHHRNHHNAYVGNLNGLVARFPDLATKSPEEVVSNLGAIPEAIRTPVRNNMGGHWNHTFFWDLMTPGGAKQPTGDLKAAIDQSFGGFDKMAEKFNAAGLTRFGSGWAWLVVTKDKKLDVINTPYQDPPIVESGGRALVGVDVWEHAYYLKYQNRRPDYLKAWWNTVNWTKADDNFKKAMG